MHFTSISLKFIRREDGALTAFGLFMTITMICVGGLAIDVANAVQVRTHLQVAADSAAHAALVAREYNTEAQAKVIAINVAQASLPPSKFGTTIQAQDIQFGQWDTATSQFTPQAGSTQAVLVSTQRLAARGNPMATYFLKFAGLWSMDVVSDSVFETYYPTCFREGFVADDMVDVQSNNHYTAGFCIHSNDHVEVNNDNTFDNGVIVSMPYETDIVTPSSNGGWGNNPGIQQALRSGSYRIRILNRINEIIAGFDDTSSKYYRADYLNHPIGYEYLAAGTDIDNSNWVPGRVHEIDCGSLVTLGPISNIVHTAAGGNGGGNLGGGNGGGGGGGGGNTVKIPTGTTLIKGVIYTDCIIQFGSNVTLEDVLIVSTNTDIHAIDGASGVTLGRNDGCAAGGGTQIVTLGGVNFPADLSVYGSQIITMKKIDFEANANGVEGVSMVSGGMIDSTSNMNMGFCNGAGLENRFEAEYFRLVR